MDSRLRRNGHSIRLRHDLEYRLATSACVRIGQQLYRAENRRTKNLQACPTTCWRSSRDDRIVARDTRELPIIPF